MIFWLNVKQFLGSMFQSRIVITGSPCAVARMYENLVKDFEDVQKTGNVVTSAATAADAPLPADKDPSADECAEKLSAEGIVCRICANAYNATVHRPCIVCTNRHVICRDCALRLDASGKPCPYCRQPLDIVVLTLCQLLQDLSKVHATGGRVRRRQNAWYLQ
jgi:hypothetical protein